MLARSLIVALGCLSVAGCSSSSGVTTGSLFGSGNETSATVLSEAPTVQNDPFNRALHVGATSARAVRCGFHFDAPKLKADYMAYEAANGLPVDQMAKVGTAYSTGFNGVAKGISDSSTYCSASKTKSIKASLTRYLAGDYTPPPTRKVANKGDPGIFGGLFDADVVEDNGPKWGSGDWWEKQEDTSGG